MLEKSLDIIALARKSSKFASSNRRVAFGPSFDDASVRKPRRAAAASARVMYAMSQSEYDALIYPGFLRRNVARWNDDGSAAPLSPSARTEGGDLRLAAEIGRDRSRRQRDRIRGTNDPLTAEKTRLRDPRRTRRS